MSANCKEARFAVRRASTNYVRSKHDLYKLLRHAPQASKFESKGDKETLLRADLYPAPWCDMLVAVVDYLADRSYYTATSVCHVPTKCTPSILIYRAAVVLLIIIL